VVPFAGRSAGSGCRPTTNLRPPVSRRTASCRGSRSCHNRTDHLERTRKRFRAYSAAASAPRLGTSEESCQTLASGTDTSQNHWRRRAQGGMGTPEYISLKDLNAYSGTLWVRMRESIDLTVEIRVPKLSGGLRQCGSAWLSRLQAHASPRSASVQDCSQGRPWSSHSIDYRSARKGHDCSKQLRNDQILRIDVLCAQVVKPKATTFTNNLRKSSGNFTILFRL
jgi:hypothetical protein